MEEQRRITELTGPGWAVTFDAREAPEYVLLTIRGAASLERTRRLLEVMAAARSYITLPTGQLCPVIVDIRQSQPAPAALLRLEYAMVDAVTSQVSCIVFLLDPERPDAAQLRLALEAIGLGAASNMAAVASWEEALAQVRAYHQRHKPL